MPRWLEPNRDAVAIARLGIDVHEKGVPCETSAAHSTPDNSIAQLEK